MSLTGIPVANSAGQALEHSIALGDEMRWEWLMHKQDTTRREEIRRIAGRGAIFASELPVAPLPLDLPIDVVEVRGW